MTEKSIEPFAYPTSCVRRHAPAGYANYKEFKPRLRDEFVFRCVYCLHRERWSRDGAAIFGVEHIAAQSSLSGSGLICDYDNLLYACNRCNSNRMDCDFRLDMSVFELGEHLIHEPDGTVVARTEKGMELIDVLRLNASNAIADRRRIRNVLLEYQSDPQHPIHVENYFRSFGYPDDLPDLQNKRPPGGNALPDGARDCHFSRRARGELPTVY